MAVRQEHIPDIYNVAANWRGGIEPYASFYGPPLRVAHTARGIDSSLSWSTWVGAKASLEEMWVDQATQVERYRTSMRLATEFADALELPTPTAPIVSCTVPDTNSALKELDENNIKVAIRDRRLRISFHFYKDERDAEALRKVILRSRARG